MKKSILISAAIVTLAMLASCQKEQFTENAVSATGVTEFFATIEQPTTKTAIAADGKVSWKAGDEITVTDAASKSAVYVAGSGGASTTFTLKEGQTAVGTEPYTATYGDIDNQIYDAAGANCPLTAPETSTTTFKFASPYAVVKITAKSDGSEVIESVVVNYNGKDYSLDCGDGKKLTSEGIDFFVSVNPATVAALSATFHTADKTATKTRTEVVTLAAKDLLPVTFAFAADDWIAPDPAPEVLPGVFTVGPGENNTFGDEDDVKVNFLRGNLWWQESDNSWHIEDHQYDVPKTYNRKHLGLFYYFGDATVSNYGTKDLTQIKKEDTDETIREKYGACFDYYASDADWGDAYGKGHTLTYDEWGYLLSFDKNKSQYLVDDDPGEEDLNLATDYSNDIRNGRYKEKVDVVGHIGMLLVPDDWDLTKNPLDKTSYSATEWAAAEAKGAVFLPYVRGYAVEGQMLIMPSPEYYQLYLKMVEEAKAENPTEEIPEYSDLIMPYFFCQGLYDEDFVVLTNMLMSTEGNTVMVTWYNWDSVSSMRLVEYVK